jgi:hypothetical protein
MVELAAAEASLPECPQLKMLRLEGEVYFGAVPWVSEQQRELRTRRGAQRHLLVMAKSMNFIDLAAADMWRQELTARRASGGDLYFHRPRSQVLSCARLASCTSWAPTMCFRASTKPLTHLPAAGPLFCCTVRRVRRVPGLAASQAATGHETIQAMPAPRANDVPVVAKRTNHNRYWRLCNKGHRQQPAHGESRTGRTEQPTDANRTPPERAQRQLPCCCSRRMRHLAAPDPLPIDSCYLLPRPARSGVGCVRART